LTIGSSPKPLITVWETADGRVDGEILSKPRGNNLNATAYAVAVRFRTDGLYSQPISAVPTVISQEVSPLTHVANHDVEITIVVDISERCAPASPLFLKNVAGKHPHEKAGPAR